MRGIPLGDHMRELFMAFGVVAGLISAPPGESASEGADKSMYQMIVKIILIVMTLGWVLTGITAKIAYDQATRNQEALIKEMACYRTSMDTMSREHEVVKSIQARVLEELKVMHQTDNEIWRAIRLGVKVEKENRE